MSDTLREFGRFLLARRVAMGKRNRAAWARELGLPNDRVLFDIEQGKRDNFTDATLAGVDQWYELEPGTAARAIRDGVIPDDRRPATTNEDNDEARAFLLARLEPRVRRIGRQLSDMTYDELVRLDAAVTLAQLSVRDTSETDSGVRGGG